MAGILYGQVAKYLFEKIKKHFNLELKIESRKHTIIVYTTIIDHRELKKLTLKCVGFVTHK